MTSSTTGDRRWGTTRKSGMTILGKVTVPKPINLPSQRLENQGLDRNVKIVPKGTLSWSSKPSLNAWGTSSLSPRTESVPGSPSHLSNRPSSGGGVTQPSTADSNKAHDSSIAWDSNSRPSSASGVFPSNQVSAALQRPHSADTRPGSSQLSRFAEAMSETSATWDQHGVAPKKIEKFSFTSGDFPSLGTEKESSEKSTRPQDAGPRARPASSSGRPVEKRGVDCTEESNVRARDANTWRRDNQPYSEDAPRHCREEGQLDFRGSQSYPNADFPHQYDTFRGPPVINHQSGGWYRGNHPNGAPMRPGGFHMDPFPYYPTQVPPVPGHGAGPRGNHSTNGKIFRPRMVDSYVHPRMQTRPGFYPGPVPHEGYFGPHMGYGSLSNRDLPFSGRPAGPQAYNKNSGQCGYDTSENSVALEQNEPSHSQETQRPYKVLLKPQYGRFGEAEAKREEFLGNRLPNADKIALQNLGRADHQIKQRMNSEGNDGCWNTTSMSGSSHATLAASSESFAEINVGDSLNTNSIGKAGSLISADPNDNQRTKMRELARQRVQQRQKEEEERARDQRAKALAKLEELNRRSQVAEEGSVKNLEAASNPSILDMPEDPWSHSSALITSNSDDVRICSSLEMKTTVAPGKSIGPTGELAKTSMQDQNAMTSTDYENNIGPIQQDNLLCDYDGAALKHKRLGYKQKQDIEFEKKMAGNSFSVATTDVFDLVPSPEVSNSDMSLTSSVSTESIFTKRKNNRNGKENHMVEETTSNPTGAAIGKEKKSADETTETGWANAVEMELGSVSVPSLDIDAKQFLGNRLPNADKIAQQSQGRAYHQNKQRMNSEGNDGLWNTIMSGFPHATLAATSESFVEINVGDSLDTDSIGKAGSVISADPNDNQATKMRELARQRVQQRQKEEEERARDQRTKALAKLEELNRRSQVAEEGLVKNLEAASNPSIFDMPEDPWSHSPALITSNSDDVRICSSLEMKTTVALGKFGPTGKLGKTSMQDKNAMPSTDYENNIGPSQQNNHLCDRDDAALKQKSLGYKQKQDIEFEKKMAGKSFSVATTDEYDVVPSPEVSNSDIPRTSSVSTESTFTKRKNNLNGKEKHKVEETTSNPTGAAVGKDKKSGDKSTETGAAEMELGSVSVPNLDIEAKQFLGNRLPNADKIGQQTQGRAYHQNKQRVNSEGNDGLCNTTMSGSSHATLPANSESFAINVGDSLDTDSIGNAGSVISADPNDNQGTMMRVLARQRVQQRQKEEEERARDQRAKALAKLEELNRRSQVDEEGSVKNMEATSNPSILDMPEDPWSHSLALIASNSDDVRICSSLEMKTTVAPGKSIGPTGELGKTSMQDKNAMTSTDYENNRGPTPQDNLLCDCDGAALKQKPLGYKQNQDLEFKKKMAGNSFSVSTTDAFNFVPSPEVSNSDMPATSSVSTESTFTKRKNNRNGKKNHKVEESTSNPTGTAVGKEKTSVDESTETGRTKASEMELESVSVPSLDIKVHGNSSEQISSFANKESQSRAKNNFKSQQLRRTQRSSLVNKPAKKFHGSTALIWAPIHPQQKANISIGVVSQNTVPEYGNSSKSLHQGQPNYKSKRVENERYVAKPVNEMAGQIVSKKLIPAAPEMTDNVLRKENNGGEATEILQTFGSTARKSGSPSKSRHGNGRQGKHFREHGAWHQRGSASTKALEDGQFVTSNQLNRGTVNYHTSNQTERIDLGSGKHQTICNDDECKDGWYMTPETHYSAAEEMKASLLQAVSFGNVQAMNIHGKQHTSRSNKDRRSNYVDPKKANKRDSSKAHMQQSGHGLGKPDLPVASKESPYPGDHVLNTTVAPNRTGKYGGREYMRNKTYGSQKRDVSGYEHRRFTSEQKMISAETPTNKEIQVEQNPNSMFQKNTSQNPRFARGQKNIHHNHQRPTSNRYRQKQKPYFEYKPVGSHTYNEHNQEQLKDSFQTEGSKEQDHQRHGGKKLYQQQRSTFGRNTGHGFIKPKPLAHTADQSHVLITGNRQMKWKWQPKQTIKPIVQQLKNEIKSFIQPLSMKVAEVKDVEMPGKRTMILTANRFAILETDFN